MRKGGSRRRARRVRGAKATSARRRWCRRPAGTDFGASVCGIAKRFRHPGLPRKVRRGGTPRPASGTRRAPRNAPGRHRRALWEGSHFFRADPDDAGAERTHRVGACAGGCRSSWRRCRISFSARWQLPVVSYALPALIAIGQTIHHHRPSRNPLARLIRTNIEAREDVARAGVDPAGEWRASSKPRRSRVS